MMSWVEGLMMGIRLLRMGAFQSPLMNNCLVGIEISIFLLSLMYILDLMEIDQIRSQYEELLKLLTHRSELNFFLFLSFSSL
jgi:hypothetical protein